MSPWISFESKLPPVGKLVLLTYNPCHLPQDDPASQTLAIAEHCVDDEGYDWYWRSDGETIRRSEVIHWMPIPPLPEEKL